MRKDQTQFLQGYRGGYVGLTATPGAGKTTLLVQLIGQLLAQDIPIERILVLSYTRAASQNFRERLCKVNPQLQTHPLDTICTIHSFAYRLIQPYLERLNLGYEGRAPVPILPLQKRGILEDLVSSWLVGKEAQWQRYLKPDAKPEIIKLWRAKLIDIAHEGISLAKQQCLTPLQVRQLADQFPERFFVNFTSAVFTPYEQRLMQLNLLDFDDMVNRAIMLLTEDLDLQKVWQQQFSYLLEDEAQDSTAAQHQLLHLVAGQRGNWVRVGDPNQAIFSSFTASDPRFLREFCEEHQHYSLTEANRSVEPIIEVANRFLQWVIEDHPQTPKALLRQYISCTPQNPQPHPHSQPRIWHANDKVQETREVITRALRYLRVYPDHSVAILAFSHRTLDEVAEQLRQGPIDFIDRRQGSASEYLKKLTHLLRWIWDPLTRDLWTVLGNFEQRPLVLSLCSQMNIPDWLDGLEPWRRLPQWSRLTVADREEFLRLTTDLSALYHQRQAPLVQFWMQLAHWLDPSPTAQATAETLAQRIILSGQAPTLSALVEFLQGQRGREFSLRSSTPEEATEVKGQIELCTLHSAKGREWDGVFLMGVSDYWFPSGHEGNFQGQLDYVTIFPQAQLKAEFNARGHSLDQEDFTALLKDEVIAERLRLLYVGMTRPRYYLSLSSYGQPALPLQSLEEWLLSR